MIRLVIKKLISPEEINRIFNELPNIIYKIATRWNLNYTQKGRLFEDEIIKKLQSIGYDPWKAPGSRITVAGLSDVQHEEDIVFVKRFLKDPVYLVEMKWRETNLITKDHIMIFNQKALDIYSNGYIDELKINRMYRIFISSQPLTVAAFKMCLTNGILVLMPFRPDLLDRSKREGGPTVLPPIEWAIVTVNEELRKTPQNPGKTYLLKRLRNFREKIFRDCSSLPHPNIHKGNILLNEYRTLIWEVDPNKLLF